MKILLINQNWLQPELRALGHEVEWVTLQKPGGVYAFPEPGVTLGELFARLPAGFTPDRLVYLDDSAPPWIIGLEQLPIPSLFYSVDTHHHFQWHPQMGALFDRVLVAQKDYLRYFAPFGCDAAWFPLWASRPMEPQAERPTDVSFRGNLDRTQHPKRAEFFAAVQEQLPVDTRSGPFQEVYTRSKIVLNESVRGDLNFRVFEAMSGGAMLLTPLIKNGLTELFTDRKDLVLYESWNVQDAVEKIRYYLQHEDERSAIAESGYRRVMHEHTAAVRASQLAAMLEPLRRREKLRRNVPAARVMLATLGALAGTAERRALIAHETADLLERSLNGSEQRDDDFVSYVALCKCSLDDLGLFERAEQLISAAYRAYPEHIILALGTMDSLLRLKREAEAEALAANVSERPKELLQSVPRLLAEVRDRVRAADVR